MAQANGTAPTATRTRDTKPPRPPVAPKRSGRPGAVFLTFFVLGTALAFYNGGTIEQKLPEPVRARLGAARTHIREFVSRATSGSSQPAEAAVVLQGQQRPVLAACGIEGQVRMLGQIAGRSPPWPPSIWTEQALHAFQRAYATVWSLFQGVLMDLGPCMLRWPGAAVTMHQQRASSSTRWSLCCPSLSSCHSSATSRRARGRGGTGRKGCRDVWLACHGMGLMLTWGSCARPCMLMPHRRLTCIATASSGRMPACASRRTAAWRPARTLRSQRHGG
jgi:hypothetical protein